MSRTYIFLRLQKGIKRSSVLYKRKKERCDTFSPLLSLYADSSPTKCKLGWKRKLKKKKKSSNVTESRKTDNAEFFRTFLWRLWPIWDQIPVSRFLSGEFGQQLLVHFCDLVILLPQMPASHLSKIYLALAEVRVVLVGFWNTESILGLWKIADKYPGRMYLRTFYISWLFKVAG